MHPLHPSKTEAGGEMNEDLNTVAPYPRWYGRTVVGAVHTYFWWIGGSAFLGLFLKPLTDTWAWTVAVVAGSILFVLCAAVLTLVPMSAVGYMAALDAACRTVPGEAQPELGARRRWQWRGHLL